MNCNDCKDSSNAINVKDAPIVSAAIIVLAAPTAQIVHTAQIAVALPMPTARAEYQLKVGDPMRAEKISLFETSKLMDRTSLERAASLVRYTAVDLVNRWVETFSIHAHQQARV